jgi:Peptidase family M28
MIFTMLHKFLFVALISCLLHGTTAAQNALPVIRNLRAAAEPGNKEIVIRYDVEDADNSEVKITFLLIADDGQCNPAEHTGMFGDVGYPVKTGKDKMIVFNCDYFSDDITRYRIKLVADDLQKPDISGIVGQINLDNIKKDIAFLSKKRFYTEDSAQLNLVKEKIEGDFRENDLLIGRQEFLHAGHKAANLSGLLQGVSSNNNYFVVGAHWDAVKDSPGSDDNASGVAGMLEVMRVLSNYEFNHSVYFVGFDMEEQGLLGSREFVSRLRQNNTDQAGLTINLDMIGYHSTEPRSQVFPGALKEIFPDAYKVVSGDDFRGDFILNLMNEASHTTGRRFDSIAAIYVPDLKIVSLTVQDNGRFAPEAFRSSDHASFWDADMKAISLGDTGDMRNFNYHSSGDVIESIDFNFINRVVKATAATIAALAGVTHSASAESMITIASKTHTSKASIDW